MRADKCIREATKHLPNHLRGNVRSELARISLKAGGFQNNECYRNAYMVMLRSKMPFKYYRGVCLKPSKTSRGAPAIQGIEHCWVEIEGHRVELNPAWVTLDIIYPDKKDVFLYLSQKDFRRVFARVLEKEELDQPTHYGFTHVWFAERLFPFHKTLHKKHSDTALSIREIILLTPSNAPEEVEEGLGSISNLLAHEMVKDAAYGMAKNMTSFEQLFVSRSNGFFDLSEGDVEAIGLPKYAGVKTDASNGIF